MIFCRQPEPKDLFEDQRVSPNLGDIFVVKDVKTLIKESGGIFIGPEELKSIDKIAIDEQIPPIPDKFSYNFFQTAHPIRTGQIANHIILAYEPESNQWLCIEKNGFPNSSNLTGLEQDRLLQKNGGQIEIDGVKITSPEDSNAVKKVLENLRILLESYTFFRESKYAENPFRSNWVRTNDTSNAEMGCRVVLGYSFYGKQYIRKRDMPAVVSDKNIYLLTVWE